VPFAMARKGVPMRKRTTLVAIAVVLLAAVSLSVYSRKVTPPQKPWGVFTGETAEQFLPPPGTVTGMRVFSFERMIKGEPPEWDVPAGHIARVLGLFGWARRYEIREGIRQSLCMFGRMTLSRGDQEEFHLEFGTDGSWFVLCCNEGLFMGDFLHEVLKALAETERNP
jgi:hypothetical protein